MQPITAALKSNPSSVTALTKQYKKEFKKDPTALVALGNAYLAAGKTAEAKELANQITSNKRFANNGDAWILLGDIAVIEANDGDAGPAAAAYETAMSVDPKNKLAYERYATVNRNAAPEEAIRVLKKYKEIDPTYQVEAKVADLYYNQNQYENAIEWYKKGDASNYSDVDFSKYALSNYQIRKAAEALAVCEQGLAKFASNANLTRVALWSSVDLEKYADGVKYAEDLFKNAKDLMARDYAYYGYAQLGMKDYNKAIANLQKAYEMNDKDVKPLSKISEAYMGLGQEDTALEYSQRYLDKATNVSIDDYSNLAQIYISKGEKASGAEATAYYNKAMDVYELMAKNSPSFADIAYYYESTIASGHLKDEAKTREINQKIIAMDEAKTDLSSNSKLVLGAAYQSEAIYYNNSNQPEKAQELANKLLQLDPENATAKQILGVQ